MPSARHALVALLAALALPSASLRADESGAATQGLVWPQSYPDAYADPRADAPWRFLDWYPNPEGLSTATHCEGRYIQPRVRFADGALPRDQQPVEVSAGRSESLGNRETRLEGRVAIRQGNTQMRADSAVLDQARRTLTLGGPVLLREPDLLVLGEEARFDLGDNAAEVNHARFVFHDAWLRGEARRIRRSGNGRIHIDDGRYTRCEPGNDGWMLSGSRITLRPDRGLGSVRNATLRIADVPVLWLPYISFPIDDERHSGFLAPRLSLSDSTGVDIAVPYYFNLAPHYDDTLTLRSIEKRGVQVENEFRYLHRIGQFTLNASWLDNDKLHGDDRWLAGIRHSGSPAPGWSTEIDATRVSDLSYFDDLDTFLSIKRDNHLPQSAAIRYQQSGFNFSLAVQDWQRIDSAVEQPYAKLPQLALWGAPQLFDSDRIQLSYFGEWTRFDRDPDGFTGSDRTTGDRLYLETRLGAPLNAPWGFLRPVLSLGHTRYWLDNQPAGSDDRPTRTQPRLTLDAGLFFDRTSRFLGRSYTQTLEPRLFFVESPYRNQDELPDFDSGEFTFSFDQLFREDRFSGRDRTGDTRQLTVGLTSRLLDADGSEQMRLSGGQVFYFRDRRVTLDGTSGASEDQSDLLLEAEWQITRALSLSADGRWAGTFENNEVANLKLAWRGDPDHQLVASYRFTENELEQLDLSAIWQLDGHWSLLGRWLQDLANAEPLDRIAGLEYESCCWRSRLIWRSWVNDTADQRENSGLFFQILLKGLGGFGGQAAGDSGSRARSFLKEIDGFEQREDS